MGSPSSWILFERDDVNGYSGTHHIQTLLMADFTIQDPVRSPHAIGSDNATGLHRTRGPSAIH